VEVETPSKRFAEDAIVVDSDEFAMGDGGAAASNFAP